MYKYRIHTTCVNAMKLANGTEADMNTLSEMEWICMRKTFIMQAACGLHKTCLKSMRRIHWL